jgi:hypothetical protein
MQWDCWRANAPAIPLSHATQCNPALRGMFARGMTMAIYGLQLTVGYIIQIWTLGKHHGKPKWRKGTGYHYGMMSPNYPVPALQRCRWCYGDYRVCDYNGTGYWCPDLCFSCDYPERY